METAKSERLPHTALFRNRYLLVLIVVVVLVAGWSAVNTLPRLEDPRITQRNPTILTLFPGASAERVESLISKPIEDSLRELYEIKTIESTSGDGVSLVSVELEDWTNGRTNQQVFSKIRDRLADVASDFPSGAGMPDFDDQRGATAFTLVVALSAPREDTVQLGIISRLAKELADRLRNIGGTEIVELYGDPREEITITVSEKDLAALDLNNLQLASLVEEADSKNSAGSLRSSDRSILMEVDGEFETLSRIRSIPVGESETGGVLYLGDIARIEKTLQSPPDEVAFTKAENRSILLAARMTTDRRVDQWTDTARDIVDGFVDEFGVSVEVETVFEQNSYTNERLGGLSVNLAMGVLVVMLVVLVAMGWKPSLIVGLALPLAMAGAVFSLSFFGEQIHQMTVFGMIIAIGLLIDNAIVVTDEVRKNIKDRGFESKVALSKAVCHLKAPLFASTFTTILAFMPIFLLPGNIGDFIGPIAISVVMALACSFALSLTVIATLAAIFTKPESKGGKSWWRSGLQSPLVVARYRNLLAFSLRRPVWSILIALILPFAGFVLSGSLPTVFFPDADRDHFEIQVWLPEDSSVERTEAVAREIDERVQAAEGVLRTHWLVGNSTPSVYYNQIMNQDGTASYAHGIVFAEDADAADHLIPRLQTVFDENFPEARIIVRAFSQGPPVSAPVSFRLVGPDAKTLRVLGEQVRLAMVQHHDVSHAFASIEGGKPKLWLAADEDKARLAGLTLSQVALQFQSTLDGITSGTVLEDLENLPVRVRGAEEIRGDFARIASLKLSSPEVDGWLPVTALGEIVLRPSVSNITRRNGQRVNQIDGFLEPNAAAVSVTADIQKVLAEPDALNLPPGYALELGGDADEQDQAVGLLVTYLPVLLILMVATLILVFRSVSIALLIFVVAGLSSGLGFLALWISGYPMGFNPLLGTAGLMGVAINGSIVVLAAIRANPKAAGGDLDQIADETIGCSRHILSTSFTTVAGFTPLLLGGGAFWPPLAVVIAGGVAFSTTLSLLFTPAAYSLGCMLGHRKTRLVRRLRGIGTV
ncbi:MAG: efflux RND transporter permease subunit [Verrucomicrobiota bacterium]